MQLRDPMTSTSFVKTSTPVDPRFMGLLIAAALIAMVCSSILISILFQRSLAAAPILVRGGQVYPITAGGTGTWLPISTHK